MQLDRRKPWAANHRSTAGLTPIAGRSLQSSRAPHPTCGAFQRLSIDVAIIWPYASLKTVRTCTGYHLHNIVQSAERWTLHPAPAKEMWMACLTIWTAITLKIGEWWGVEGPPLLVFDWQVIILAPVWSQGLSEEWQWQMTNDSWHSIANRCCHSQKEEVRR